MKTKYQDEEAPGIEMSSMIDCVFLLLIFFLVAATIRKKHNELPIELPTSNASSIPKAPEDDTMIISIYTSSENPNEVLYQMKSYKDTITTTGGKQFDHTLNSLRLALADVRPDQYVRIDADRRVAYGKITQIIDMMRVRNLTRFGLRTVDK